jgi:hypothetical protein
MVYPTSLRGSASRIERSYSPIAFNDVEPLSTIKPLQNEVKKSFVKPSFYGSGNITLQPAAGNQLLPSSSVTNSSVTNKPPLKRL